MKRISILLALFALVGCSSESGPGRALFEQRIEGGNTFTCSTCHALSEPADDGFRRAGHAIGDAARRPSYKNGAVTDLRSAVNSCLTEWMAAEPWAADGADWKSLEEFLHSQAATASAPTLSFQIVDPPTALGGGDLMRGRDLFNASCALCHGANATGTDKAPPLTGSLLDAEYIAERVRKSGSAESSVYPGLTGGRMPFWALDRLSDDELRDLIAFVLQNDPDLPVGGDEPDAGPGGDCAATHALVGQSAELTTRYHGVAGTATVIDDCTIELSNFSYDGGGIDVRIYGGLGGNFSNGFAMSGDLRRAGGYQNETITATIPEGKSLDDLDSISIWCVDVDQSFGDAQF